MQEGEATPCPTPDQLVQYNNGNVPTQFASWIVEHVCECERCAVALKAVRAAERSRRQGAAVPAAAQAAQPVAATQIQAPARRVTTAATFSEPLVKQEWDSSTVHVGIDTRNAKGESPAASPTPAVPAEEPRTAPKNLKQARGGATIPDLRAAMEEMRLSNDLSGPPLDALPLTAQGKSPSKAATKPETPILQAETKPTAPQPAKPAAKADAGKSEPGKSEPGKASSKPAPPSHVAAAPPAFDPRILSADDSRSGPPADVAEESWDVESWDWTVDEDPRKSWSRQQAAKTSNRPDIPEGPAPASSAVPVAAAGPTPVATVAQVVAPVAQAAAPVAPSPPAAVSQPAAAVAVSQPAAAVAVSQPATAVAVSPVAPVPAPASPPTTSGSQLVDLVTEKPAEEKSAPEKKKKKREKPVPPAAAPTAAKMTGGPTAARSALPTGARALADSSTGELEGVSTNDPTKLDWAIDPSLQSAPAEGTEALPIEAPPGAAPASGKPASDEDLVASLSGPTKTKGGLDESFATLVEGLELTGLMPSHALQTFLEGLPTPPRHPEAMARELLKTRQLSGYQVGLLLGGRAEELVIGPYVVNEKVSETGQGMMYSATNRTTHQLAALKTFPRKSAESSSLSQATRLEHPHLVVVLDQGHVNDNLSFLATEFLAGGDMVQRVRREGRVPLLEATRYTLQAAQALLYAKSHGLLHGNINPTNLLIDDEDNVKISDLGWCGMHHVPPMPHDSAGDTRSASGGPSVADQIAPEIFAGSAPDIQTEIYSLGCTFAYLVLGVPMKLSKSLDDATDALPNIKEFVRDAPPVLTRVFRRMVAKYRKDRYRTYEDVIAALEAIQDPEKHSQLESTDGGFTPLIDKSSLPVNPNTRMGLVAAMLVTIILGVVALVLFR